MEKFFPCGLWLLGWNQKKSGQTLEKSRKKDGDVPKNLKEVS